MKKIIAVCLVFLFCVGLWFWRFYGRKSNDNIPSKELMVSYCQNHGEDYASELLQGYKNTQLAEVWGKPDGTLFGFWGDIWETNDTHSLIVYYDSDGIVDHVKVMGEDGQEDDFADSFKLQATIVEIADNHLLVQPLEDSSGFKNTEQIIVPMENMASSPEPQVGDILEIVYRGDILPTMPAELTEIQSIRVIEKWVVPPMVMVNDTLYLATGMESTVTGRCGMLDGEITSSVAGTEIPKENDQSNFGIGYGYQYGTEGTIELFIQDKWWVYAAEEARQEMQFPSESISTADADSAAEDLAISNALYLCQFVKDCLGEPDSFQIHGISYLEENGRHFYYLDFSHETKKEEMVRTYYFAEFDGSALLCIVHENSAIHYQTDGDYTEKYQVLSALFREESSEQLDAQRIVSKLA